MRVEEVDPKGLIRESYRIEGITAPECRSIFMDWALGLPAGIAPQEGIRLLLATYVTSAPPDHPMTGVLTEGLAHPETPRRRGGRAARVPRDA